MRKNLLVKMLPLFLMLLTSMAWAQERTVTGKVTSAEDGSDLPGVNVVVKGTTNGTVTDSNGKFSLSVESGNTLVFSFIGLKTEEASVGERAILDIQLASDITQLSEIVVTGTGVATEKRKLAIAVESVSADKLPSAPTASIDQALVGKIAGAQISSVDGTPGAKINILLRGVNTINRGTNPMILVDGVQMGATDLSSLDLNTVERVEVVQGAAAATIYGAQGANGVIQVFSKKGKAGKVNIDISSGITQNTLLNLGNVGQANLHNYDTNVNGDLVNASGAVITLSPTNLTFSGNVNVNLLDPQGKFNKPYSPSLPFIDQLDRYLVSANTVNNSISLSGGKEKSDFSISVSNNHQDSNFKGDGYNDRTNLTTNLGFEVFKGFELRSITQLIYTKNTVNYFNTPGYGGGSVIYRLLNTRPFADYDAKDVDGNYGYSYGAAAGANATNPNYNYQFSDRNDNKIDIVQSLAASYKLPKFVDLSVKYGMNFQNDDERNTIKNQSAVQNSVATGRQVTIYNSTNKGETTTFQYKTVYQNLLATATGVVDFQKDLKLNIPLKSTTQVGFDWRKRVYNEYWTYGLNAPTFTPSNAANATTFRIQRDYEETFVTYGYLLNQRFDYGDIAGISGGFRSDYSSAFGAGSTPFTFPRGDAYLRLSSLKFWDNTGISKVLIEFKLRAAYGKAGIQPKAFDRYETLSARVLGSGVGLYFPATQATRSLDVEVSEETELGTDASLDLLKGDWFRNLNLSFSYWTRSTANAIYDVDTAPSSGVGTYKDNAFSLASNGVQFSLNMPVLTGRNIAWNFTTNFSKQYSEISAVKNNVQIIALSNAGSSNYILRAGEAVGQLYGYKLLQSLDQTDENGKTYLDQDPANLANYEVASNGYVVSKTSKQPVSTPKTYSLGNSFPKFNMSFINEITFKSFLSFGFQLDWVYKSHLYNQTKSWMYRDAVHKDYQKEITINGESGAWSAFYRGVYQAGANNGTKDYFYEDATFLRLRNISVAVDFAKLYKLPGFRKLQLVLAGRNLWTLTNYTGFDPEVSSGTNNSAFDRGVDHSTLPNYRSYQATLNIGF
jgi:TonB-dependent starch-binding outer membrane protein SusC